MATLVKSLLDACEAARMDLSTGLYYFNRQQRDYLIARARGMAAAETRIRNLEREVERLERRERR